MREKKCEIKQQDIIPMLLNREGERERERDCYTTTKKDKEEHFARL
jgi:hypothetical protein